MRAAVPAHIFDQVGPARDEAGPPLAMRLAKRMMYKQREMTFETALEDAALLVQITDPSEDARVGLRAFYEKRKPIFKGR